MNYAEKIYNARRKSAICRLKVQSCAGMKVNDLEFSKYFYESTYYFVDKLYQLLDVFNLSKSFSFSCRVTGGGKSAQCSSILYATAKALRAKINEEFADDDVSRQKMLSLLRKTGYLTVDTRKVEPKKYGLRKSRAQEQFVRR